MNEWDERVRQHAVWTEMASLGSAIDNAYKLDGTSLDRVSAGLERLRTVLAYVGKRLAAADPLLTPPEALQNLAGTFSEARSWLERFASEKNPDFVTNANSVADRALSSSAILPGAYSPEELGALIASAIEYRAAVDQNLSTAKKTLKNFETTSNSLQIKLDELASTLQGEQQKLARVVSDYQGQFSSAQEQRSKEYSETLRVMQQDVTKLVTEYQSQFSAGQDTRSKEFVEAQRLRQTAFDDAVDTYSKRLADQDSEFTRERLELNRRFEGELVALTTSYDKKAAEILSSIEKRQEHVEKLVGVIGNLGVTSGYLRTANQARLAMWIWQGLTVAAMLTLSGVAYKTLGLIEDRSGHINWGGFAGRVLLLVSFGVIAAYAGSQADKLFVDEKRNRKLALELEAIGPYLAPLPLEEQNKFRVQIGDRSFGREFEIDARSHRKSPVSVLDLLKSKESKDLMELLIQLSRKAGGLKD